MFICHASPGNSVNRRIGLFNTVYSVDCDAVCRFLRESNELSNALSNSEIRHNQMTENDGTSTIYNEYYKFRAASELFSTSHSLITLPLVKFASRCPFGEVNDASVTPHNSAKMLRIAVTFDALFSKRYCKHFSRGKYYPQRPLAVAQEANEFEDDNLWKIAAMLRFAEQ